MNNKDNIARSQEELSAQEAETKRLLIDLGDLVDIRDLSQSSDAIHQFARELLISVENNPEVGVMAFLRTIQAEHYPDFVSKFRQSEELKKENLDRGGWRELGLFAQILIAHIEK